MKTEHGTFGVGVGVMIKRENAVLLGKRHDDRDKADSDLEGQGSWTLPGGSIDFCEKLAHAAAREVKEETDIDISPKDLTVISIADDMLPENNVHFVTVGFLAQCDGQEPKTMEPDEITQWRWFDLDNLPSPLFKPTEKVLRHYKEKQMYVCDE
ncbi:MAG: NUDIX domain-containing protein [Candidatus Paceibacterota bacterium]